MPAVMLYPWTFQRLTIAKPWAGGRLARLFPTLRHVPANTGETIELAGYAGANTPIAHGDAAGRALPEMIAFHRPGRVLGFEGTDLPVMIKLLDTGAPLSVQVHPSDVRDTSGRVTRRGKHECWLVLHAEPGAGVWQGVKPGIRPADAWHCLDNGEIGECLNWRPLTKGDFLDNPAGMIHAIGPGLVLLEIQQACDVTLRIHDWGRPTSPDRPLQLAEAKASARLDLALPDIIPTMPDWPAPLVSAGPWHLFGVSVPLPTGITAGDRARVVLVASGAAVCDGQHLMAPSVMLLPAESEIRLVPLSPVCHVVTLDFRQD